MGIGGTAACAAHLSQAIAGMPWSPVIAGAAAVVAVEGWVSLLLARFRTTTVTPSMPEEPRWWLVRMCFSGAEYLRTYVGMTALLICGYAAANLWGGVDTPHADLVVRAMLYTAIFMVLVVSMRRGWLRGVLFDPERSQKKKQADLARQREEILATARQNYTN